MRRDDAPPRLRPPPRAIARSTSRRKPLRTSRRSRILPSLGTTSSSRFMSPPFRRIACDDKVMRMRENKPEEWRSRRRNDLRSSRREAGGYMEDCLPQTLHENRCADNNMSDRRRGRLFYLALLIGPLSSFFAALGTIAVACSRSDQNKAVQALNGALVPSPGGAGKMADVPCFAAPPGTRPARDGTLNPSFQRVFKPSPRQSESRFCRLDLFGDFRTDSPLEFRAVDPQAMQDRCEPRDRDDCAHHALALGNPHAQAFKCRPAP